MAHVILSLARILRIALHRDLAVKQSTALLGLNIAESEARWAALFEVRKALGSGRSPRQEGSHVSMVAYLASGDLPLGVVLPE